MRAVVIYESMYGNTHQIAVAVAEGLAGTCEVSVASVAEGQQKLAGEVDLLVVGGPTHVHGMSRPASRRSAVTAAEQKHLKLDASAPGPGLREWLSSADLPSADLWYATYDTRLSGRTLFTGRASTGYAKLLHRRGYRSLAEPNSFLVNSGNHLLSGEIDRARRWGAELAAELQRAKPGAPHSRQGQQPRGQ